MQSRWTEKQTSYAIEIKYRSELTEQSEECFLSEGQEDVSKDNLKQED